MGEALGGRGKRRRNIAQKHGGAKDGGGVNSPRQQHSAPEVTAEHRGLLVQHLPWSGQQKEAVAKTFVIDQIPPYNKI